MYLGSHTCCADTWTTLDNYPGASSTSFGGVSKGNIVGTYSTWIGNSGFVYNGTIWKSIHMSGSGSTRIYDINNNCLVDAVDQSGALYNMTTQDWTLINMPGASTTEVYDIEGDILVGSAYQDGFIYNITTQDWTILTVPIANASNIKIVGIDGSRIIGNYSTGIDWETRFHSFLYDTITQDWTFLDMPGSWHIFVADIDGDNIVGYTYLHGFLYNLSTQSWTILDYPGADYTSVCGIDGNKIVGSYHIPFTNYGFTYTIPEPTTLVLLSLGVLLIRRK